MLARAREHGVPVLLVGVPVPGLFAGPPAFYEALAATLREAGAVP
jgi:hypothetical protein